MKQFLCLLALLLAVQACGRKAPLTIVPGAIIEPGQNAEVEVIEEDFDFNDYFADEDEEEDEE